MPRPKPIAVDELSDDEKLSVLQEQDIFGRLNGNRLKTNGGVSIAILNSSLDKFVSISNTRWRGL
jgi:hypothetical protein